MLSTSSGCRQVGCGFRFVEPLFREVYPESDIVYLELEF